MLAKIIIGLLVIANYIAVMTLRTPVASQASSLRPLWMQVEFTMNECGVSPTTGRHHFLARQIARITEATFIDRTVQESYIVLLCIESKFNTAAKSKAGAYGIAQIMPDYASEFANECALPGTFVAADLLDAEVNITLGACRFRTLMGRFGGNVALALAGYNSGAGSSTTRRLAGGANGATETSEYLARYLVMQEKLK